MAIKQVRAQLNGTWHTLALDSASDSYKGTFTAPGATSHNLAGGYYPVTVEVTNTAGTVVTATAAETPSLRLVVRESVKPVISVSNPTAGAFLSTNTPDIKFTVTDEAGGSGVNLSAVSAKIDGAAVTLTNTAITNGYRFTGIPSPALTDGAHTLVISAADYDGNQAEAVSVAFTVDTVPPELVITFPAEDIETNAQIMTLTGVTNDATSSIVGVNIALNGKDQGEVAVGTNGTFAKALTLTEGRNIIVVTSTDMAGKASVVTRTVTLDTTVPVIKSAEIAPNPADADSSVTITVTLE